jgi:hypothetical protein
MVVECIVVLEIVRVLLCWRHEQVGFGAVWVKKALAG